MQTKKLGNFAVVLGQNVNIQNSHFLSQTTGFYKTEQRFISTRYFNLPQTACIDTHINFN